MNKILTREKLRPYLWATIVYFIVGFFNTIHDYPNRFFEALANNTWHIIYVIVVNFMLFEYSIPFVLRKREMIIYNILLGIPLFFLYMMLYSFGGYVWRQIGIGVHIYTPLTT